MEAALLTQARSEMMFQTENEGQRDRTRVRIIRGPLIRKGEYRNTEDMGCERGISVGGSGAPTSEVMYV